MKLTISTILTALAFGVAFGANAELENRWVKVEGGSWIPSTQTISRINQQIESFVGAQAKAEGRKLREWAIYTFQYQGQEDGGRKFVFVNAFCVSDMAWRLNKRMVMVTDGGSCFFNVKYDPEKNQFFELLVNNEG
jgi:hypothetical protein